MLSAILKTPEDSKRLIIENQLLQEKIKKKCSLEKTTKNLV
jgi:hypothetical protein